MFYLLIFYWIIEIKFLLSVYVLYCVLLLFNLFVYFLSSTSCTLNLINALIWRYFPRKISKWSYSSYWVGLLTHRGTGLPLCPLWGQGRMLRVFDSLLCHDWHSSSSCWHWGESMSMGLKPDPAMCPRWLWLWAQLAVVAGEWDNEETMND